MPSRTSIAPGAHLELRDAVWRVKRVDSTSTGGQAWLCEGVSAIVRDQEAIFLEELEPEVRVLDPRTTLLVRDTSSGHRAGLLYIESLLREVPPPDDGLYVGHGAAMDVFDFQLEPAWLALQKLRERILIADAVGLGKTLEAGILLSELIRRGRARRILVATTKAMLTQFQKELWGRFTIPLVRLDSVGLARIRAEIPSHHNPFYHFDKTIISIDTLKQNNWFRTHVEKAHWDVIVIDEAQNVAHRGSRTSQRASIASTLARNCDSLILLSATPHDGRAESFASLMNMLDPTAIADPSSYTKEDIQGLYVRRFKRDVAHELADRVPEPKVMESKARASAAEERAFDAITSLELPALDHGARGGVLFRTGLVKAIFSSPRACLAQMRAPLRRKTVSDALAPALRRELLDADSTPTSEALDRAADHLAGDPLAADLRTLAAAARAVEAIGQDAFSKYWELLRTLDRLGWSLRRAKEDRLLLFTERRETLAYLEEHLVRDLSLSEGQWQVLHGGLSDVEQQSVVEDFGKTSSSVRILLASDVASEGLNLHYLCHRLIHFDVPWSLMVFQQRNGRVDRYGQTEAPEIVYLRTESDNEMIRGDNRILDVLREKAEQARENLGDPSVFMNLYDVQDEEQRTALAIQSGTTPEALSAELDSAVRDPFSLLLEAGASGLDLGSGAPTRTPVSLFASDFDFAAMAVERLRESLDLEATIRPEEQMIELRWTKDLEQRYRRLPAEVRPEDGVVLLTADSDRMQRALEEARKQESAWPVHQLLWANSPVLDWLADRVRAGFGRHAAPVLVVPALGGTREAAVLVSGLLASRQGQPLVQRWYAARFTGERFTGLEPFEDFLEETRAGRQTIPNDAGPVDLERLQGLLPDAVEEVRRRVLVDRDRFRAETGAQRTDELARLHRLRGRQLSFLDESYENRRDAGARRAHDRKARRIVELFRAHEEWIESALTTADEPFLEVVAVLVGAPS